MSSCWPAADRRRAAAAAVVLLLAAAPLAAQEPADTVPRPPTRDSLDQTGLLLRAEEDAQVRLPTMPRVGIEQLLPWHARIVFPRDTLNALNVETVGDVLAEIPGVWLWRGGWLGRPEPANYLGRGATSVEYLIDGVPHLAMGPDSLAVDPSLLPLGFVDRIEVERLPGLLRVHLMLREHDVLAPWSRIGVARGTYDQAVYEGLLQRRTRSGFGYALGGSYLISPAFNRDGGDFDTAYGWVEASYVPRADRGARIRYRFSTPDRSPALAESGDTLSFPVIGTRSDLEARLSYGGAPDGLGTRADLMAVRTAWRADSLEQSLWRVGASASKRTPTRSLGAAVWYGTRWTKVDARVQAGWVPRDRVSLALEGAWQRHKDDRKSRWVLARAGVELPMGVLASGSARVGEVVTRPAVLSDTARSILDVEGRLSWDRPRYGLSVAAARLDGFQPVGYRQFAAVDSIGASGPTEWIMASARLAPRQWFTVQGWYSHPLAPGPDGVPPTHSMVTAAIESKFLRTFPSGIFTLRIAVSAESWGTGVLGRDGAGEPVTLRGATFLRGQIQLQFSDFVVYYDRYNLTDTRSVYIPGFRIPSAAAMYGVRWAFLN